MRSARITLSTLLLQTAGIPLPDYNQFLSGLYQEYPVISSMAVIDSAGKIYNSVSIARTPLLSATIGSFRIITCLTKAKGMLHFLIVLRHRLWAADARNLGIRSGRDRAFRAGERIFGSFDGASRNRQRSHRQPEVAMHFFFPQPTDESESFVSEEYLKQLGAGGEPRLVAYMTPSEAEKRGDPPPSRLSPFGNARTT